MNAFELLSPAIAIAGAIAPTVANGLELGGELVAGREVTVPPIRTYFGSLHVEIDVTVKPLPPP